MITETQKILIIDDEADYASIGFKKSKEEGIEINTTTAQIDTMRKLLQNSSFLQVTATPYSLYLQPESIEIKGNEVSLKGMVHTYEVKDKIEQLIVQFKEVAFVNNELALINEN